MSMLRDLTLSSTLTNQRCFYKGEAERSGSVVPMPCFSIGGIQIEFVNQWPHLGHLITDSLDDNNDISVSRNTLCGQIKLIMLSVILLILMLLHS